MITDPAAAATPANPIAQAVTGTGSGGSSAALSSDFETFLKMLTVQLQNQDPLNPVEASDYSVQLATFSGVEQQVKTNELLSGLTSQLALLGLAQFSSWVGMEARHVGPANFDGTPIQLVTQPAQAATSANLVVRDPSNQVVEVTPITLPGGEITWSGLDNQGLPYPPGDYSFFVESYSGSVLTDTSPAPVYSVISEAANVPGGVMLTLAGGTQVAADSVEAVRAPGQTASSG